MHRRDPETEPSRAPGSRKSWTQLVKWRANVAHPSKLETSSVYLHPSWKFQNAQPNTAEWLAVSRTTNLALPFASVHKGGNVREKRARGRRSVFTAGVARRKKPSSYRQSRVRRDKNLASRRRNDSQTERMENSRAVERIFCWISPSARFLSTPPYFLHSFSTISIPFSIAHSLTQRDLRDNSFPPYIRKWNIGRSFVLSSLYSTTNISLTDFLMCSVYTISRSLFNVLRLRNSSKQRPVRSYIGSR